MSTATAASPWTKKATSSEGGDLELPPGGTYPGCLVAMIDLGTHEEEFNHQKKEVQKIYLVWELCGEYDTRGETFKVGKDFTFSLNAKSKLRPFLEGWLGRKFADNEDVNLMSFMTMNGVVNVTEGQTSNGRKYVDVASVTKPMKGLAVPDRTVEPLCWGFADWDPKVEPPIPDWVPFLYGKPVAGKIKSSKEWASLIPF